MQLSSLIFLVVVVIWAAYLIQHWVRRRENLATARSVDRFSEAMRLLERKVPLPASQLVSPAHSYAVQRATAPLRARSASSVTASSGTASSAPSGTHLATEPSAAGGPAGPARSGGSGSPARPGRSRRQVLARKLRGIGFLVTLAAVPTTAVLSKAHVLRWVSVLISVVAFALVVVSLRLAARRGQASRRVASHGAAGRDAARAAEHHAELRPAPRAARPRTSSSGAAAKGSASTHNTDNAVSTVSSGDSESDANAGARAERRGSSRPPEDVPYGFAPTGAAQVAAGPERPGAWSPVPVPPPTYTLKDAAPRSMAQPAELVTQRPVPIEVEDDDLERLAVEHHWRAAGG